jgi:hypothetical protein
VVLLGRGIDRIRRSGHTMITPFSVAPNLTPAEAYNLLVADMFDRLPSTVIESAEGQQVIRYFCEKLTLPHHH